MNAPLAEEITNVRFATVRSRGYDMVEVDTFLDTLAARVSAGQPVADLVSSATFSVTRLRQGYAEPDVDDFLDKVVRRAGESGAADAAPAPADAPIENVPIDANPVSTGTQWVNPVAEVRSPLSRLFRRGRS